MAIRRQCPASPCPYCILELQHGCDMENIVGRWNRISVQYQGGGGCEFAFAIQRIAYLWLCEADRAGIRDHNLTDAEQEPSRPIQWHPPARESPGESSSSTGRDAGPVMVGPPAAAASASTARHMPGMQWLGPPPPPSEPAPAHQEAPPPPPADWPQFDWHVGGANRAKKWRAFNPEHQVILRTSYLAGQQHVVLTIEDYQYDVYLTPGDEKQVARHGGFTRRVRVGEEEM